jgi:hypothetical protein
MTIKHEYQELLDRFPFLSLCKYGGNEYVGIIQNHDSGIASMYIYSLLTTPDHKKLFLEYGDEWWWASNRMLPINIILGEKFKAFSYCLKTFNAKDFEVVYGHTISLSNIITKRIKRRQIQLVKKLD